MKSGIYYIRCTGNGKIYVGQSYDIKPRWSSHLYELRQGKHYNIILQRSFDKYGEDSFEWNIITRVPVPDLDQMEIKWINFFDCMAPKGFNIRGGGESIHIFSKSSRQKMSNNRKGMKFTTKHCENISKGQKNRAPMTEKTKRKMAESQKARWLRADAKKARTKLSRKFRGTKRSPETRLKISNSQRARLKKEILDSPSRK